MSKKVFLSLALVFLATHFLANGTALAAGGPGEGGDSVAPATPTGVGASSNNSGISLNWSAVTTNSDGTAISDLNDYRVWRSAVSGSGFSVIATVTASAGANYSDANVSVGTTYYYKVTARDTSANESAQSSEVNGSRTASGGGPGGGGNAYQASDSTPPQNVSTTINNGDATVSTTTVFLALSADGATEMKISNYPTLYDGVWRSYATSSVWKLLSGDGVKIVYVQFRDVAANVASIVSDSIILTGTGVSGAGLPPPVSVPSTIVGTTGTPSQSQVPGVPGFKFTRRLSAGARGDDVKKLQAYLAGDKSLYPEGLVSGYYGSLTKRAVQLFQEKHGIAKLGDPGYGEVGPKTQAKLNSLAGGVPAPVTQQVIQPVTQQQISPVNMPVLSSRFTKRLQMGVQNEEVRNLQKVLASDKDVYPEGLTTGYYGALTVKAVQRFQEKHGIAKLGDPGYGEVGPATRAKLNNLVVPLSP